ncbi:MAG: hypothetical protein ACE5EQ_10365, partial [Phycisphaerae bacterium]
TLQALLADRWQGHDQTGHSAQAPSARAEADSAFRILDYHLQELMSRPAKLSSPLRLALGLPDKG